MSFVVAIDVLGFVLLLSAFRTVWGERMNYYSLKPLLPAVAFLAVGRIIDILLEHPSFRVSNFLGVSRDAFEIFFGTAGNFLDVAGILFLTRGFVRIIGQSKEEQRRIRDLETLLPICSSCKKYKTDDGQWLPIERYLKDMGAPKLTHGFCPDCMQKIREQHHSRGT